MAESTPVAVAAASIPIFRRHRARCERSRASPSCTRARIPRTRSPPAPPRRRALDAALAEIDAGAEGALGRLAPRATRCCSGSSACSRRTSPTLADGTVLSAHQVDALSGTLTALLAEAAAQRRTANGGGGAGRRRAAQLASAGIPGEEDDDDEDEPRGAAGLGRGRGEDDADAGRRGAARGSRTPRKRFWFEHATGAGKTVAALGFVEASRTGGVLILTHRRNLVDQFHGELRDRGYAKRISPRAARAARTAADGPVTVETYQWFVRNAGNDLRRVHDRHLRRGAHRAGREDLGARSATGPGPIFIGMTATGALIARHVTDLFPTQTSRFDLAQAARRGVIAPLRCVRIPPGPGVRTIAKVPLRRGEVDTEFDQEMLAELLDQPPFNLAVADLYKTRFNGVPGRRLRRRRAPRLQRRRGVPRRRASRRRPSRARRPSASWRGSSPRYERGDIDVLVNAQLLAEGWNSPRATVCMHLAPTASKRIYQQRVGRVTRRQPGKEAGIVVDFVHPATKHDDPVVTLHSLLDRDVYRGGAIVVGPVRRGRGRRLRVERRVLPVTADEDRRDRGLRARAVADRRRAPRLRRAARSGPRWPARAWRRTAGAARGRCCTSTSGGELKRRFLLTAVAAQQEPAAAPARAAGDRRGARRRGVRPRDRHRRRLAARREARGRQGRAAGAGREADRPPRPGQHLDLAPAPSTPARCTRSTPSSAGPRPSACSGCSSTPPAAPTRATPGGSCTRRASRTGGSSAALLAAALAHTRRGRRGHQRRAHAHGAQAGRARARAAAQLPEGQGPARPAPAQEGQGRRVAAPVEAAAAKATAEGARPRGRGGAEAAAAEGDQARRRSEAGRCGRRGDARSTAGRRAPKLSRRACRAEGDAEPAEPEAAPSTRRARGARGREAERAVRASGPEDGPSPRTTAETSATPRRAKRSSRTRRR